MPLQRAHVSRSLLCTCNPTHRGCPCPGLLSLSSALGLRTHHGSGMNYLHNERSTASVIHRDLKSSNILLAKVEQGDACQMRTLPGRHVQPWEPWAIVCCCCFHTDHEHWDACLPPPAPSCPALLPSSPALTIIPMYLSPLPSPCRPSPLHIIPSNRTPPQPPFLSSFPTGGRERGAAAPQQRAEDCRLWSGAAL